MLKLLLGLKPTAPTIEEQSGIFDAFMSKVARQMRPFNTSFDLPLPAFDHERFPSHEGGEVTWRRATVPMGRAVWFHAHEDDVAMAWHAHPHNETLLVKSGILAVEVLPFDGKNESKERRLTRLGPGDSITIEANTLHAAHYMKAGECLCWWPALESEKVRCLIDPV